MRPTPSISLRSIIHTSLRFAYSCSVGLGTFFFKIHFSFSYTSFYLVQSCSVFSFHLSYPPCSVIFAAKKWAVFVWVCVLFLSRYCAHLTNSNHYKFVPWQIPLRYICMGPNL